MNSHPLSWAVTVARTGPPAVARKVIVSAPPLSLGQLVTAPGAVTDRPLRYPASAATCWALVTVASAADGGVALPPRPRLSVSTATRAAAGTVSPVVRPVTLAGLDEVADEGADAGAEAGGDGAAAQADAPPAGAAAQAAVAAAAAAGEREKSLMTG